MAGLQFGTEALPMYGRTEPVSTNFVHRPKCDLCGSDDNTTILLSKPFSDPAVWDFLEQYYEGRIRKVDLEGGSFKIAKCLACGFIWQSCILNDTVMDRLYSEWISADWSLDKKRYGDSSLFSGYARQVEIIAGLVSKKPYEADVLDFGAGWGYWCLMANAFGYKVKGFEISAERNAYARNLRIAVIDSFDALKNHKFDFINSEQVFEHVSSPLQVLQSLADTLKEGGVIRIAVPNGQGIEKELSKPDWKATKNATHPLEHINCFTRHTLANLGQAAGLELISAPLIIRREESLKAYAKVFLKAVITGIYRPARGVTLFFRKQGL